MKNARQVAYEVLLKVYRDAAYSNITIDAMLSENNHLDSRDSAFVCALVYGTLDRQLTLDYNLSLYLDKSLKKLKPELLVILRMGTYQLLFMDKVPASAAVNESVKLARSNGSSFGAPLVNAILRKVADNGLKLPDESETSDYLSIRYSCPEWLIRMWLDAYGYENTIGLMDCALEAAPVTARVNPLKTTPEELVWTLAEQGVEAEISKLTPNSLFLHNAGSIERLDAYNDGLFHVQDTASQLCAAALGAQLGETVFDMCSAPGGKAFTIAQNMQNTGRLFAFDVYQSRVDLIKQGAKRLGLTNIVTFLSDASVYNEHYGKADRVLCDVPCSGLGIIRRKPEIRFKNSADIDNLPDLQYRILCNAVNYVKSGGLLMYSTCTLNPAENSQVCDRFLAEHPDYKAVTLLPELPRYGEGEKYLTLMPHIHSTDGFFMAAFRNEG